MLKMTYNKEKGEDEIQKKKVKMHILRKFCGNAKQINQKIKEIVLIKRFTQADLDLFSKLTGDYNPIHSLETPKDQRKVHGAFLNAIVAGIMGSQLPGPGTIVLEQKFKFPNACRLETNTEIRVQLIKERKISIVEYVCRQNELIVLEGEAKLLIKNES